MKTIELSDEQHAVLKAFVEQCAGYDSAMDAMLEAAAKVLGHTGGDDDLTEKRLDEEIALVNATMEAIS